MHSLEVEDNIRQDPLSFFFNLRDVYERKSKTSVMCDLPKKISGRL